MGDTGESDTARVLAEMQATMEQVLIAIKSGSTSMGINPLPGALRGIQDSGSFSIRSGKAGQRKCSQLPSHFLRPEMPSWKLSSVSVWRGRHTRTISRSMVLPIPVGQNVPILTLVVTNLPKDTVRMDAKAKWFNSFWLIAVTPLAAGLRDIEDGKGDIQDAAKSMQASLMLLGIASQYHAVQHRQAVLQ